MDSALISRYVVALTGVYGMATNDDIEAGRVWYPMARGDCYDAAIRYDFSIKRACFAAAALSNNMEWSHNVALLEHVMFAVRNGTEPHGHYAPCLRKAVAILGHGDYSALSGPKVVPFAHALLGDTRAAVIDRWMYRAAAESGWQTERRARNIAVALRVVAKDVKRSVSETQAIIWTAIRRGV